MIFIGYVFSRRKRTLGIRYVFSWKRFLLIPKWMSSLYQTVNKIYLQCNLSRICKKLKGLLMMSPTYNLHVYTHKIIKGLYIVLQQ